MLLIRLRYILALIVVAFYVSSASGVTYRLSGAVQQRNVVSGEPTYNMGIHLVEWFPFGTDEIELELIAPDGTRFQESFASSNGVFASLEGILPQDLDAQYSGPWMIEETLNGSTFNQYQFEVPEMLNSPRFVEPPIITSPADGAVLGPVFDVTWINGQQNGCAFRLSGSYPGTFVPVMIDCDPPGQATFTYALEPGFLGVNITSLSTYINSSDPNGLFPVTPLSSGADASFTSGDFGFETHSPAIALTVVPEPARTSLMTLVAFVFFTAGMRRGH